MKSMNEYSGSQIAFRLACLAFVVIVLHSFFSSSSGPNYNTTTASVPLQSATRYSSLLEPDSIVEDSITNAVTISAVVQEIRASGYRCDSVHTLAPFVIGEGYHVSCNRSLYHYDLKDVGGRWLVSVE